MKNREIPINLKRKVYENCILPVTTYGLKTMTIRKKYGEQLRENQKAIESAMLGIRDKKTNVELRILRRKFQKYYFGVSKNMNRYEYIE